MSFSIIRRDELARELRQQNPWCNIMDVYTVVVVNKIGKDRAYLSYEDIANEVTRLGGFTFDTGELESRKIKECEIHVVIDNHIKLFANMVCYNELDSYVPPDDGLMCDIVRGLLEYDKEQFGDLSISRFTFIVR